MSFVPCEQCRRHVEVRASTCPFCAAPRTPASPGGFAFARASRAAVFAGAALTTGCWSSSNPAPPHDNEQQQQQQQQQQQPTGTAIVKGRVTEAHNGTPLANVLITVAEGDVVADGPVEAGTKRTTTDADGRYELALPAGAYTLTFHTGMQGRMGYPRRPVRVDPGEPLIVDMQITMHSAAHPIPAPYGAPPARRRVV